MKKPIIYAHRGSSAYAPENTAAAFKKALEQGAGGIELDVHLTRDGRLVVIHDETVDRTSSGTGWVKDMTLNELKGLDFGSWFGSDYAGERIPTLQEVLELLTGWDGILNIEIKSGVVFYEGIEAKVVDLLRSYDMIDRSIISSFDHYCLLTVKKTEPRLRIGLLYSAGLVNPWEYAAGTGAEAIHPYYRSLQPPVIKGCIEHGIIMNPWTVNRPEDIRLLAASGVDGIITNVPDIAAKAADEATSQL